MTYLAGTLVVPDAKIADYLLDPDHPIGGAKASFFESFGFMRDRADLLTAALLDHADRRPVYSERAHSYGVNRDIRCNLPSPDGRDPCIVAVWFQAVGSDVHRLVTAYPA